MAMFTGICISNLIKSSNDNQNLKNISRLFNLQVQLHCEIFFFSPHLKIHAARAREIWRTKLKVICKFSDCPSHWQIVTSSSLHLPINMLICCREDTRTKTPEWLVLPGLANYLDVRRQHQQVITRPHPTLSTYIMRHSVCAVSSQTTGYTVMGDCIYII